jgi:hypothetical protein
LWDPSQEIGRGNPATAPEVKAVVDTAKARDSELGERLHSAAMTKEYMKKIMGWSENECPDNMITSTLLNPSQVHQTEVLLEDEPHNYYFLFFFISLPFTLL